MMLAPGTVFGTDFRVVSQLAEGEASTVIAADQLSTGKRRALKILRASLPASAWDRFAQAVRIGSSLQSPAIVEVVNAGVDPKTQVPWIAMELLEGEDIGSSVKRRGAIPIGEIYEVLRQVCHGLGAAHLAGITHRNLKPENCFIVHKPQFGAKILDLGLAKMMSEAKSGDTSTMMTPIWTAPELGDSKQQIGPTTDVWSLGLIAFFALTGRVFWTDPKFIPSLIQEMLFQPIPPASQRAQQFGVAQPPAGFDAWFARCMMREPHGRFPNANDAWLALEPILRAAGGGSIAASPLNITRPPVSGGAHPSGRMQAGGNPQQQQQQQQPQQFNQTMVTPAAAGGVPVWLFAVAGIVLGLLVALVIYFVAS